MRTAIGLLLLVMLVGCSYQGKNYFEEPKYLIRDPHFSDYQEKRNALESKYLSKEITYGEYVKQADELEETYSKEVQTRESNLAPVE